MSGISQTYNRCENFAVRSLLSKLRLLTCFFKTKPISKTAKIYHGNYAYNLIPDTAINDFMNMHKVTSVVAGDCYICVFEKPHYQGNYYMIGPGEKAEVATCGSIIVGMQKFSIDMARNNRCLSPRFWELSGPVYQWHFSSGYRYV